MAELQQAFDPTAKVTHNERLRDRLGHVRQFDVVIRGKIAGHDVLGVIECKDLKRRVGTNEINALADKANNVRANLVAVASTKGFTRQALELAEHHGILPLMVLKKTHEEEGIAVGDYWFAEVFRWASVTLAIEHNRGPKPPSAWQLSDVVVNGRNFLDCVVLELHTTYRTAQAVGVHSFIVTPTSPVDASVAGTVLKVTKFRIEAKRTKVVKRREVLWAGTGIVEFRTNRLLVPANTSIETEMLSADLDEWPDYDGPVPPATPGLGIRLKAFWMPSALPAAATLGEFGNVQHTEPAA